MINLIPILVQLRIHFDDYNSIIKNYQEVQKRLPYSTRKGEPGYLDAISPIFPSGDLPYSWNGDGSK